MFKVTARLSAAYVAALVLLSPGHLRGQADPPQEPDHAEAAQNRGIYPLPILYYTPETGTAFGAAMLYLYRDTSSQRASTLAADVIYTQKRQIVAEAAGEQYFANGRYRLVTYLAFQKYPNKFYGIGNNTPESSEEPYTPQAFILQAVFTRSLVTNVNVGPVIRFESVSIRESAPGGALEAGVLPGSGGGTSAGLGIVANWDSRDNVFAAHSGSFCQLTAMMYRKAFGSDYGYEDIQIDLRKYFTVYADHVLALQGAGEFINGSVPFQNYAKIGGQDLLRGYFQGRFRDKNGVAFQAEYRVPVWWRFGVVGFAAAAQVSERLQGFAADRFWYAGGLGLRFAWNPEERINLRLDYGIGSNSSGMYIKVTEAF